MAESLSTTTVLSHILHLYKVTFLVAVGYTASSYELDSIHLKPLLYVHHASKIHAE